MDTVAVEQRILTTAEMSEALGLVDTDRVGAMCRKGLIPGAWRIPPEGNWRIYAAKFREYLTAHGIPTDRLDSILES